MPTETSDTTETTDFRGLAFIDWASKKHQVCLLDAGGTMRGERSFEHGGAGLAELCQWLLDKSGAAPGEIAVGLEVSDGPLVETLLEQGFAAFHLNPKQLDRFRDRYSPAGAKDDRRDARVGAGALRTDRAAFRRLAAPDPLTIQLRAASRLCADLTAERTALTNRLREQLWRYYKQALDLCDELAADWFLAFWTMAPTPAAAAKLRLSRLARLFQRHGVRRHSPEQAQALLRRPALTVAPGTTEAAVESCRSLVARLQLLNRELKRTRRQRDALVAQLAKASSAPPAAPRGSAEQASEAEPLDDVTIIDSAPAAGEGLLAALLAEAPEALARHDHHALRALAGAAPVTRQSGKLALVRRRLACNHHLRTAVFHWARVAAQIDPHWRQRYAALRARGKSHGCALRIIADQLLRILCAMLKTRTLYDPERFPSKSPPASNHRGLTDPRSA
jgi:transposase